ncbi:MAG: acetolactate synthase small subunit [Clostridia bacterium]|nr:acetolactate synthase small subunit [Clostridia bacterium]
MDKLHYISMLVSNNAGVLTRISGLISRRGYNIESLSVCKTEDENLSRMTISLYGDEKQITALKNQLIKQIEVNGVTELAEDSVLRELLLIKLEITPEKRSEIIEISSIFKAKTIDLSQNAMVLELTGNPRKIDAFIEVLRPYDIIELARSGTSALHRGQTIIKDFCL